MKYLCAFCLIYLTQTNFGQVNYTSTDGPVVGQVEIRKGISLVLVNGDSLQITGADRHWDLSAGDADSFVIEKNIVLPLTATPFSSQFKGSNFALTTFPVTDSIYTYYKKTSNGLYVVGEHDPDLGAILYTHPLIQLAYPLSFNSTFQDSTSAIVPTILGDAKLSIMQFSQVVGWGTVLTPSGSFNCVQVRTNGLSEALIGFDQIFSSTTSDYYWYSPGYAFPIASYTKGNFTTIDTDINDTTADYLVKQVGVGTKNINTVSSIHISPNPSSEYIHIAVKDNEAISQLDIIDIDGKKVWSKNRISPNETIDVRQWAKASYLVLVYKQDGNWDMEKLIIQ